MIRNRNLRFLTADKDVLTPLIQLRTMRKIFIEKSTTRKESYQYQMNCQFKVISLRGKREFTHLGISVRAIPRIKEVSPATGGNRLII
jgi:hypothetical protein